MADKNIQKALYGPSYFEVGLGAVLGILIGIVAAVLYFTFKPVEKVVLEDVRSDGSIKYYRDIQKVHHVPKRKLEDVILG